MVSGLPSPARAQVVLCGQDNFVYLPDLPMAPLVQDLLTWSRARRVAAQYFYPVQDISMPDSFADTPVLSSSSPTGVAIPVGPKTILVAATMETATLHYHIDVGEDWADIWVGEPSSASQPLPTASVNLTAVLPTRGTLVQDHTERLFRHSRYLLSVHLILPWSPLSLLLPALVMLHTDLPQLL